MGFLCDVKSKELMKDQLDGLKRNQRHFMFVNYQRAGRLDVRKQTVFQLSFFVFVQIF